MSERSIRSTIKDPKRRCRVLIVDTGGSSDIVVHAGPPSAQAEIAQTVLDSVIVAGAPEEWDADRNLTLDPAAGHGTFIAGIFGNLAPGSEVTCINALSSYGDTSDYTIAEALLKAFGFVDGNTPAEPQFDIVVMSFGGFCEDDDPPIAISRAISKIQHQYAKRPAVDVARDDSRFDLQRREAQKLIQQRVVFVASAGNDSSCRPTWPASFENVIGVAALAPTGPAWFTNYGPWVNACAPGVDIVSTFFDLGRTARNDGEDFDGWATWSGTSFAGPIVAASIAWEWMLRADKNRRPGDTAAWLLDRPGHFRYPGLGTVVNTP